jgi:hypothetical protein
MISDVVVPEASTARIDEAPVENATIVPQQRKNVVGRMFSGVASIVPNADTLHSKTKTGVVVQTWSPRTNKTASSMDETSSASIDTNLTEMEEKEADGFLLLDIRPTPWPTYRTDQISEDAFADILRES